jgi:Fur family peroxide stress response transcriptional regulator
MKTSEIRNKLVERRLKVTPQRITILEAILRLKKHPTADDIINFIKENHPNVATGTVYKVLDVLVENGLIKKVKTERDIMRYDAIIDNHHHLYCFESDRIEDYFDQDLSLLIDNYFEKKGIPNFEIKDLRLQIIGKFK